MVEADSTFFILADERIPTGLAWHVYNAFSALPGSAWFDVLRQYGVKGGSYAGFVQLRLPDGLSYDQQREQCRPFFAPNRLVLCLPSIAAGVEGFWADGWAAYHSWTDEGMAYSIVPCGDWPGWERAGGTLFGHPDSELIAATHEWAEYMTDPTGEGIHTPAGEVGDDCNWQPWPLEAGGWHYRVTRLYDVAAGGVCRP